MQVADIVPTPAVSDLTGFAALSPAADLPSCASCGTARVGPHCHACGQHVKAERRLTVRGFAHDAVHFVTHLDHGLPHTLKALFRSPGDLARRYVGGDRAHHTSPLVLLLLSATLVVLTYPLYEAPMHAAMEARFAAQWAGMAPEARALMQGAFGTPEAFAATMIAKAKSNMKLIAFLNAFPVAAALALMLRRRYTFAEWLVATMYVVAGVNIVTAVTNPLLVHALPQAYVMSVVGVFNVLLYLTATAWTVRRFWGPGWRPAVASLVAYGSGYAVLMLVAGLVGIVMGVMAMGRPH